MQSFEELNPLLIQKVTEQNAVEAENHEPAFAQTAEEVLLKCSFHLSLTFYFIDFELNLKPMNCQEKTDATS